MMRTMGQDSSIYRSFTLAEKQATAATYARPITHGIAVLCLIICNSIFSCQPEFSDPYSRECERSVISRPTLASPTRLLYCVQVSMSVREREEGEQRDDGISRRTQGGPFQGRKWDIRYRRIRICLPRIKRETMFLAGSDLGFKRRDYGHFADKVQCLNGV